MPPWLDVEWQVALKETAIKLLYLEAGQGMKAVRKR